MTAEMFLSLIFKITGVVAVSSFFIAGAAVCVYYSWKMAESLIKKRRRYISRIKKSHAFKAFNGEAKLEVVKKKVAEK